jgi:YD repeat-containing protein
MSAGKMNRRQWLGRLCAAFGAATAAPWLRRAVAGAAPAAPTPVAPVAGLGTSATFVYDAGGMLAGVVNPGQTTTFTYEGGRLVAARDAAGNPPPLPPQPLG